MNYIIFIKPNIFKKIIRKFYTSFNFKLGIEFVKHLALDLKFLLPIFNNKIKILLFHIISLL